MKTRNDIITSEIVCRFLLVTGWEVAGEELRGTRYFKRVTPDGPITIAVAPVDPNIAYTAHRIGIDTDALTAQLTRCVDAEELLLAAIAINGRTRLTDIARVTTAWIELRAETWLQSIGIDPKSWEATR